MKLHSDAPTTREFADYVVSPMYGVLDEHSAALALALLIPLAFWLAARWAGRSPGRVRRLVKAYRAQASAQRLAAWLIALSAAAHVGLVLGHDGVAWPLAYLTGAVGLSVAFTQLLAPGRYGRRVVVSVLTVSLLAYAANGLAGSPPDQVGLATKLAEITALAIAVTPTSTRRRIRLLAGSSTVLMVLIVSISAWVGALASGAGGHHAGETPAPGVALPVLEEREPTDHEIGEATALAEATRAALAAYVDPAAAAADGYRVDGVFGKEFHADNPAYKQDGRILDPMRPETLVYGQSPTGPVLLGAMFQMDDVGEPGPAPGGPLTVWHAHDHVCFSLLPPGLAGLRDPFGICPVGSVTLPLTNEMLHVWILPGLEDPFGDLDETWLDEYLAFQG